MNCLIAWLQSLPLSVHWNCPSLPGECPLPHPTPPSPRPSDPEALGTHGTVWVSSRPPPGRAGHTRGHRQQWCHRNRRSPRWTHRSKCHKCRCPGMAPGPPTERTSSDLSPSQGENSGLLWLGCKGWGWSQRNVEHDSGEWMGKEANVCFYSGFY